MEKGFAEEAAQANGAPQENSVGLESLEPMDNGIPLENLVRLRHLSSGRVFLAPESYVYHRNGKVYCKDYSDACLEIAEGDRLSVINATPMGYLVKKNGVIGWYRPS